MSTIHTGALVVGQVLETGRYGRAVIARIHDRSQEDSVIELVGSSAIVSAIVSAGNAAFDLVYYNGVRSKFVPECIIRGGLPWIVHSEVISQVELDRLNKAADDKEHQDAEDKARADAAFTVAKNSIQEAPEYKHLKKMADNKGKSEAVIVSGNIRSDLKKAFPGVKFSVKKSSLANIWITWTDGPTKEDVGNITAKYEHGNFNGMEDIYEYSSTPFNSVYGGIDYVSTNREVSDQLIEKAIIELRERFGIDSVPETCNALMYRKGNFAKHSDGGAMYGLEEELRRLIMKMRG